MAEEEEKEFGEVIPEEALAEVEEMFDLFDKNKDGTIDLSELESVFTALGQNPTPEELSCLLQKLFAPNSSFTKVESKSTTPTTAKVQPEFISKPQFLQLMSLYMQENANRDLDKEIFQIFDKNGDGLISKEELRQVFLGLGEDVEGEDLEEMFNQADTNGDGNIDYDEFRVVIQSISK